MFKIMTIIIYFLQCLFTVYGLQEFYRQPENITATQGATVYLKCIIKNKGAGEVQWTKGGFGLGFGTSLLPYERHSVISQSKILPSGYELGNVLNIKTVLLALASTIFQWNGLQRGGGGGRRKGREFYDFLFVSDAVFRVGKSLRLKDTLNPLYKDILYNREIRFNVNLVGTKISRSCIFLFTFPCYFSGEHTFCVFVRIASARRF